MLFSEPDLLLLDEPTNYLDLEGTLWLQDHLAKYPKTMIVISHDRDLLDSSVDFILSLEHAKLTLWRGGYSAFEAARDQHAERLLREAAFERVADEIMFAAAREGFDQHFIRRWHNRAALLDFDPVAHLLGQFFLAFCVVQHVADAVSEEG